MLNKYRPIIGRRVYVLIVNNVLNAEDAFMELSGVVKENYKQVDALKYNILTIWKFY